MLIPQSVAACAALLLAGSVSALPSLEPESDSTRMVNFRRQNIDTAKYPPGFKSPPKSSLPQDWVDALETLQSQGKIPNIPQSKETADGVSYPKGVGGSKDTCSWTVSKCYGPNDIHEVPDNTWVVSFDDGPTAVSSGLYDFLHQHNQPGTHFLIGTQILSYPDQVRHAMETQQQPAVHTWSHSLQTTKNNYEIVGELGWTMQIIYDLVGVVPKYWRPPQGDIDARVRAIAEGVFNITAVMWNDECNDWCLEENGKSDCPGETPGKNYQSIVNAVNKAVNGAKSPGAILLEHELTKYSVGIFEDYYPKLNGLGWNPRSVPDALGVNWYFNAANNDGKPINVTSIVYSTVANETSSLAQAGGSANSTAPSPASSSASSSKSTNVKTGNSTSQSANAPASASGSASLANALPLTAALATALVAVSFAVFL